MRPFIIARQRLQTHPELCGDCFDVKVGERIEANGAARPRQLRDERRRRAVNAGARQREVRHDRRRSRLRGGLELLPQLAKRGLCDAAKDIGMAGTPNSALMLFECSRAGPRIDLARIPRPDGVRLERWVAAFRSFDYLLSVRAVHVDDVQIRIDARGLACAVTGSIGATSHVDLHQRDEVATLWDVQREPFTVGQGNVT